MTYDHKHFGRWARRHGADGGERWGGRGRRGGRLFDQGDLRLVMLAMISEQPRHGYDIIKALEELTGGEYSPSPGVVYPTLTLLQEQGLADASDADGGKKLYTLTEAGRAALDADKATVDAIFSRVSEAAARSSAVAPRLLRAMENLRTALRLKLAQGGLTEERLTAIVRTIDEAAATVERA
jgi:DNA-binding PadR family transcriptional regulator